MGTILFLALIPLLKHLDNNICFESKQHKIDRIAAEKYYFKLDYYMYDRDGYKSNTREYCIKEGVLPIGVDWREEYLMLFDKLNKKNGR